MIRLETEFGSFYCLDNDLITNQLKEFGAHTRNELIMVLDHIDKDDIVIDVGSHIGTYSIPIAKKLSKGNGHLYCIEADSLNYNLLKKNIDTNKLDKVVTADRLLLSKDNNAKYISIKKTGNTGANYFIEDEEGKENFSTMTFSNYLKKYDFVKIDFIKIDVEGMEYLVLESISHILKELRPILYIEISQEQLNRYKNSPVQIETLLSSIGYSFFMNTYKRNSSENYYAKSEIRNLEIRPFFDVLAYPKKLL